jgi:hypothetical protein
MTTIVITDPAEVAKHLAPLVAAELAKQTPQPVVHSSDELITLAEAEQRYKLKRTTAWALRKQGKLSNHGHGKKILLSVTELNNLYNVAINSNRG